MPRSLPPLQTVLTGLVVAIVGFFSSFPIVLQGLNGVGATGAQAASGLMFAAFAMGVAGIVLSLWYRMPIAVAWSTPGAAVLAVAPAGVYAFPEAVSAFIFAGFLTVLAGLWKPLGRIVTLIPGPLAQAMVAGILIVLCAEPFRAMAETPWTAVPIVLAWFIFGRINRLFAAPAAVVVAIAVTLIESDFRLDMPDPLISAPIGLMPEFTQAALLGLGLPLFIVTMATQNVPGITIVRSFGYAPPPGPPLMGVGVASMASAPFGAPATCLAAITAAMCANPESHPDPKLRFWSSVMAGLFYCLFGLFAGVIALVAAQTPPMVLETVTGVALLAVFANSTAAALEDAEYREASAVAILTTASGISVLGMNAAVLGLGLGIIVLTVTRTLSRGTSDDDGGSRNGGRDKD